MQIVQHTVASIDYKLTNDEGEVLDTSEGREPLAYVHGTGSLIPGLESELEGKASGDEFQVRIPPENAYGVRDEDLVQLVPRDRLPPHLELEAGMQLQAQTERGSRVITVVGIEGDQVRLDANHPMAGVALNFEVTVVDVRAATAEEIEHGHVHGEGGHQH